MWLTYLLFILQQADDLYQDVGYIPRGSITSYYLQYLFYLRSYEVE